MHLDLRDPAANALNQAYWTADGAGASEPVLQALADLLWSRAAAPAANLTVTVT